MDKIRYLYKTKECQLVNFSLEFPKEVFFLSPLAPLLGHMGISFPHCWIRLRKRSNFLDVHLDGLKIPKGYKRPGDFDIIAGPLLNGEPTDYMVGIEVKRFRYVIEKNRWVLKKPYNFGERQVYGYSLYGFNKVLLYHYIVAEPVYLPGSKNGAVWIDNAGIVRDGMDAVKRLGIVPDGQCGYCIGGWAQIPDKDPTCAGSPDFDPVTTAPDNFIGDKGNVRIALLDQVSREMRQLRNNTPLPLIISFKDLRNMR